MKKLLESNEVLIKHIKHEIFSAEEEAAENGRRTDFSLIPYVTDDYYELQLENDGSDIVIKVFDETEESDTLVIIEMTYPAYDPSITSFSFSNMEKDIQHFLNALKVIFTHYCNGNWYVAISAIQALGFDNFLEGNKKSILSS